MRLWIKIAITLGVSAAILGLTLLLVIAPGHDTLQLNLNGRDYEVLSPRWLGLLCLLPVLWLIRGSSLVDMSRLQQGLSVGLRALILIALVIALSRPSATSFDSRICTVFLVDLSESISADQVAKAREIVNRAWRNRGENQVRLVTFAKSARVVKLAEDLPEIPKLERHPGKGAGQQTDIQAAIQRAYGLFPPHMLRRIAIISDGNQTTGDLLAESARAGKKQIKIFTYRLPDRVQKEVLVRSLILPQKVRVGAPFELTAEIYSTHPDQATLSLFKDEFINGMDGRKVVDLLPGRNRVKFKSQVDSSGSVNYRLVLSKIKQDTWKSNNSVIATLPIFGRPKVLYIEGDQRHAGHLKRALVAEKIDVEVRGPRGLPTSPMGLQKYDLLLMSDVSSIFLGLSHMAAIQSYVRDLGGGFIMAGGQNSFGAGGYYGTPIEKILPVRFDTEKKRDQPTLALVLCIDRSGSMTGPKLELAKDAAKATTEILGRSDLISVVAFDSSPRVIVRLQRAANRLRILNNIAQLQAGGGTNIKPSLVEAYRALQGATAKVKHVILLSDGQSPYGGISQLVDEMVSNKITISAVGVGGGADRTLLQMIAERGNGRFYHTDDANNIPRIFTKETTQVARAALVEESFKVSVSKYSPVIRGIDWGGAPPLRGYVSTKAKPLSETLLVSNYSEPILAMWRVGLGKTAAFTSDVKNRWAVHWLGWPGYQQFWAQLVREVMRHRIQRSFEMAAEVESGVVHVKVDALDRADRFINGLDSTLTAFDPRRPGRKRTLPMRQTAAGRYEVSFPLRSYGSLMLKATHRRDDRVIAQSVTALAAPYPQEYSNLVQDPQSLRRAAEFGGGSLDPSHRTLWDPGQEKVVFHRDLWSWVIYILFGLFFLDVLLRRIRIFGYGSGDHI